MPTADLALPCERTPQGLVAGRSKQSAQLACGYSPRCHLARARRPGRILAPAAAQGPVSILGTRARTDPGAAWRPTDRRAGRGRRLLSITAFDAESGTDARRGVGVDHDARGWN